MMRLLLVVVLLLLAGCQPQLVQQVRPDQLSFPELEFNFPQVEKRQLTNGMKLYLKEDHELPLVDVTLSIAGGAIEVPLEKTGLAQLFAATLETGGAGDLSPEQLEAELEAMAAELSIGSSTYRYTVDLSLHQQDLARGVEILADLLRRPRFDEKRFELARKQLIEQVYRQNDDPESVAARLLNAAVYPRHPFGSFPQLETLEKLSQADLRWVQEHCLQPGNIWIAVSGAVVESELVKLLEANFGDWQSDKKLQPNLPELPPAQAGRVFVATKEIPQTTIMLGHPGISKDNPDGHALRVANFILGGGGFNSRMMREIRSNRGLAYSVYSYFKIGRRLPEMFVASGETKCDSTVEVLDLMRQLIRQMRDEPVSAEELELAKQSLVNSFVFAFRDTHSIVTRKLRLDFFDYPDDYMETYREKLAAVTIADVQRVAQKYLRPDQLQIVLVGDKRIFSESLTGFDLPVEEVQL